MSAPSRQAELVLPLELRERLERWSRASYPLEACGILLGHAQDERVVVVDVRRVANAAGERANDRFEIAPRDLMALDREALVLGLSLAGTWHSHPDGPARLSELDRTHASPDWTHVVLSVDARGACRVRAWRCDGGEPVEAVLDAG